MHDSHEKHHGHHGHHEGHSHEHETAANADEPMETARLRKMVEHWISHNEDHAGSYRLWATRARDAGHRLPGELLEEIASEVVKQNEKLVTIIEIIDSSK